MHLMASSAFGFESLSSVPARPLAAGSPALELEEFEILASIVDVLAAAGSGAALRAESLDRKLRGPMSRFLPAFRHGLAAIDCACRQKTGRALRDLDAGERRIFVRELRRGHKLTAFFSLLAVSAA